MTDQVFANGPLNRLSSGYLPKQAATNPTQRDTQVAINMSTPQLACRVDEIAVGQMKAVALGEEKILIYHLADGFFATQANCTHVFAPLGRGKIVDGCKVQCPFHRARFDIRTGAVVDWANFPPGVQLLNIVRGAKALKIYPVSVANGEVRVTLP
jgi:3-phenylpropionate/trans-cinnamate dioxygenase ferredoxin subunit